MFATSGDLTYLPKRIPITYASFVRQKWKVLWRRRFSKVLKFLPAPLRTIDQGSRNSYSDINGSSGMHSRKVALMDNDPMTKLMNCLCDLNMPPRW